MDLSGTKWEMTQSDYNNQVSLIFHENGEGCFVAGSSPAQRKTFNWRTDEDEIVIEHSGIILVGLFVEDKLIQGVGKNKEQSPFFKRKDWQFSARKTDDMCYIFENTWIITLESFENLPHIKVEFLKDKSLRISNLITSGLIYESIWEFDQGLFSMKIDNSFTTLQFDVFTESDSIVGWGKNNRLGSFEFKMVLDKTASLSKEDFSILIFALYSKFDYQTFAVLIQRLNENKLINANEILKYASGKYWKNALSYFKAHTKTDDDIFDHICKGIVFYKNNMLLEAYKHLYQVKNKPGEYWSSCLPRRNKPLDYEFVSHMYFDSLRFVEKQVEQLYNSKNYYEVINFCKTHGFVERNWAIPLYLKSLLFLNNPDVILGESHGLYKKVTPKNLICHDTNDILKFGKYTGRTVREVIKNDSNYICRCVININHFLVTHEILMAEEIKSSSLYYKAMEFNIVKHEIDSKYSEQMEYEEQMAQDDEFLGYEDLNVIDEAFEGDASNLWNVD